MELAPSCRRPLVVDSLLPVDVLGPSLASGLSGPHAPRLLPGGMGPFAVTGRVQPVGGGADVELRVVGDLVRPFTPTFVCRVEPTPTGTVLRGEVVEHAVVRGYVRLVTFLPLLPLVLGVVVVALNGLAALPLAMLQVLLAVPLARGLQRLWLVFVRRLHARQDAQLREYLATCCQALPQQG